MTLKTLTATDLNQFTGTGHWYRHGLSRDMLYTEGVRYVASAADAHWLIDEIAFAQRYVEPVKIAPFQVWTLTVNPDHTAALACVDSNDNQIYARNITYTDFPLSEISLYYCNNLLLLPREY
jgi:hypothetical protein